MKLGILAMFKNEAHIIKEWLNHYISEGVTFFYLINDNSNDNFENQINEINQYYDVSIKLINNTLNLKQTSLYNKYYKELNIENECDWLIICDLDEFIYARNNYNKITDYLNTLSDDISQIKIPWKVFGSSRFIEQPKSVIKFFKKREQYINKEILCKSIIKCKDSISLNIHQSEVKNKIISSNNLYDLDNIYGKLIIDEKNLKNYNLHLNHYQLQSYNWFTKIKCTRGDADNDNNVRNINYFKLVDANCNKIKDKELRLKQKIK